MEQWQYCRTCLAVLNLNPIFAIPDHHEKYSQVVLEATGVKINLNDCLPQQMCAPCIIFINKIYRFRKKCQETQKALTERLNQNAIQVQIVGAILQTDKQHSIDIDDLINDFQYDEVPLNEYNLELDESQDEKETIENSPKVIIENHINVKANEKKTVKRTLRARKSDKEKRKGRENDKEREKQEIECEYCHKILTSKLSLRNHYKIHTGFDVVCEHCGKKFITRRLLLMHCKAKHGYEKTDKCSFCDYRASNAEQVKIHERLHTGEKPYVCATCGSGFHRKSSYLQHVAIHLPEKTVQCTQCPARFKSVTLMRIHANRHRAAQYTYKCLVCAHNFARRRNVARHLVRIHAVQPRPEHIERSKCV